jgi:flagellar hook-basal body complex protein FliE
MAISPIGAVGMPAFAPMVTPTPAAVPTVDVTALDATNALGAAGGAGSVGGATGPDFATALSDGLEKVQAAQGTSDQMAAKAATGDLKDVHDYMIASTQASLATELTVAVRNKAVEAFNEIMRMPV